MSLFSSIMRAATVAMGGSDVPVFPYTQGAEISAQFPSLHWRVYHTTHESTGDAATLFVFDKTRADNASLNNAKNALMKLKTLRHPYVLKFLDSTETSAAILVATEECRPFSHDYERGNRKKELSLALGLYAVTSAIAWINNDCKLVHGALSPQSIYLIKSGEFRLFGFDICYKHADVTTPTAVSLNTVTPHQRTTMLPSVYRTPEHSKCQSIQQWIAIETDSASPAPSHYLDAWTLGVLIFDLHANGTLSSPAQLANKDVVPQSLQTEYKRLLSTNPIGRINPKTVLESTYFTQNELVRTVNFLNELALKSGEDKDNFFTSFAKHVSEFPDLICKYKILPLLLNALNYGSSMSCFPSILASVLKIGATLTPQEFQSMILPPVVKLFGSNERAVRVHLLSNIEAFAPHLSAELINESIFAHVATGFGDSQPMLREVTVKSMPHFIGKLNSTHLQQALQWLSRLQGDTEPAIRTNTTYCIAKMAVLFDSATREKVLIPAFTRALRDTAFAPARIAGLVALTATSEYYGAIACAKRVLPAVAPVCVDEVREVREAALRCLSTMTSKLTQFHNDGGVERTPVATGKKGENGNDAVAAASTLLSNVSSWAVSSFASKFYTSNGTSGDIGSGGTANASTPLSSNSSHQVTKSTSSTAINTLTQQSLSAQSSAFTAPASAAASLAASPTSNPALGGDGWGDDFDIDELSASGTNDDDTLAALSTKKSSARPTPSKSKKREKKSSFVAASIDNDSDDGFDDEPDSSTSTANSLDNWDEFNDSFSQTPKKANGPDTSAFDPLSLSLSTSTPSTGSAHRKKPSLIAPPPTAAGGPILSGATASKRATGKPAIGAMPLTKSSPNGKKSPNDDWASFLND